MVRFKRRWVFTWFYVLISFLRVHMYYQTRRWMLGVYVREDVGVWQCCVEGNKSKVKCLSLPSCLPPLLSASFPSYLHPCLFRHALCTITHTHTHTYTHIHNGNVCACHSAGWSSCLTITALLEQEYVVWGEWKVTALPIDRAIMITSSTNSDSEK